MARDHQIVVIPVRRGVLATVPRVQRVDSRASRQTEIAALYGQYVRLIPTPVVARNHAVALAMAQGLQGGRGPDPTFTDSALREGKFALALPEFVRGRAATSISGRLETAPQSATVDQGIG
jgi:hypothetical protein